MTEKFQYNKKTFVPYGMLKSKDAKEILSRCFNLRYHDFLLNDWDYEKFRKHAGNTTIEIFLLDGIPVLPLSNTIYEFRGPVETLPSIKPFLTTIHLLLEGMDNADVESSVNFHLGNLLSTQAIKDWNYVTGSDGWKFGVRELESDRVNAYQNKESFHDITCEVIVKPFPKEQDENVLTATDVILAIFNQLRKAEGGFINQIAGQVLARPVRYIGNHLFEYTDTPKV